MDPKKLIILLVVFVGLLAAAGIIKLINSNEASIIDEGGFVSLSKKGFLISDVAWFEVWRSGKEGEKVIINNLETGWVVGSRFNAPADEEKVEKFLGQKCGIGFSKIEFTLVFSKYALDLFNLEFMALLGDQGGKQGKH